MNATKEIDFVSLHRAMRGGPTRTHLDHSALKLAVVLLTTLLALATLLAALTTLLAALLALSAANFLSVTLATRSLLAAALIFFTIVCHDSSSHVRNVNCLNSSSLKTDIDLSVLHSFKTACSY